MVVFQSDLNSDPLKLIQKIKKERGDHCGDRALFIC